jgi:TIGR03009 family protein
MQRVPGLTLALVLLGLLAEAAGQTQPYGNGAPAAQPAPVQTQPNTAGPSGPYYAPPAANPAMQQAQGAAPVQNGQTAVPPSAVPAGPNQPVVPQDPRLQVRQDPRQPLPPRIQITSQEEAELDKVLKAWEESSGRVKNFYCNFIRWEYDLTFVVDGKPREKKNKGRIWFATPDKGAFVVDDATPPERWICDGLSIYEYNYQAKVLTQHKLPPQLQGKAIADGPLPFLFGSSADQLKRRYWMKLVTPPDHVGKTVWIQAFPRYQQDAANFDQARLVLDAKSLQPGALELVMPGRTASTSYAFERIASNDLLWNLKGNPFAPEKPGRDWRFVVEESPQDPQAAQAQRQPTRR